MGKHRVMCGDNTNISDVEKLMDGAKADLCSRRHRMLLGKSMAAFWKQCDVEKWKPYVDHDDNAEEWEQAVHAWMVFSKPGGSIISVGRERATVQPGNKRRNHAMDRGQREIGCRYSNVG